MGTRIEPNVPIPSESPVAQPPEQKKTSEPNPSINLDDIKKTPKRKQADPPSAPQKNEPDDRLRWFFRAKISGVSGVKSDKAIEPGETEFKIAKDLKFEGLEKELKGLKDPQNTDVLSLLSQLKKDNPKKSSSGSVVPKPNTFVSESLGEQSIVDKLEELKKTPDKSKIVDAILEGIKQAKNKTNKKEKEGDTPDTGEMLIDSMKGDILGIPYIRQTTYQVSTAEFVINDPDDSIRKQLHKHSKVEIEAGFVNGFKVPKFVGVIFSITRKFPDGTKVEAVDNSQKMATGAPPVQVPGSTEQPLVDDKTGEKVTSTFEGEAVFMGGGVGLTATHATLPLTSRVRITNTANNKTAIVTINDKSANPGGWVLELSKDAAKAMGMTETGSIRVKAEVLETKVEKDKDNEAKKTIKPQPSDSNSTTRKPLAPSATKETEDKLLSTLQEKPVVPTSNEASVGFQKEMNKLGDRNPKEQILNARLFTEASDLKLNDQSLFKLSTAGNVTISSTMLEVAQKDAALRGQTLIARGNTVTVSAPGTGTPSGVILDYQQNRAAFINASVKRRMGVQLQSGYGAITVKGFNVNDKTVVSATAVSTQPPKQHPTGIIQVPEWGKVKLDDPIVPGSPYTWGIATRNGERIPTKEIMGNIVKIAQVISPLTEKTVGAGKTWGITSWYRDVAANTAAGGAANSYHMTGGAVDFYYDVNGGEMALYRELEGSYDGGLAVNPGSFVHIDVGPKGRWTY